MDEAKKIHFKLKQTLANETDTDSSEYENFCKQIEGRIGRGLAKGKKTPLEKLDALETKGLLAPGKYGTLRTMYQDSGNDFFVSYIDEADDRIQALTSTKSGKAARTTGGAESRGTKRPSEGHPLQETTRRRRTSDEGSPRPSSSSTRDDSDPGGDDCYRIGEHQTGYLLILNSRENRTGTEHDVRELVSFFRDELKFEVDEPRSLEERDFDKQQLNNYLEGIQQRLNLESARKFYCFICVILSHGDQRGIRTRGDDLKSVEEIRKMFNNRNIPMFTGRPKLFFVQACRGLDIQEGANYDDEEDDTGVVEDEDDASFRIPVDADTLIGFSTTPGYKSFRRTGGPLQGSWFIQELVRVFRDTRQSSHVEDMMVKVRGNVATNWTTSSGGKQMPCVWTTLTKKLRLKSPTY